MSAKWRALQHRHRYTYNAVVFPNSYTESLLTALQTNPSSKFYTELNHLVSLNSIYSQINHAKKLASSFNDFLSNANSEQHEDSIREASRFYLELLFLENSQPLHKTLVSSLSKSQHHHSLIRASFHALFLGYADHHEKRQRKNRFFCASRVALSVLGLPKLGYLADVIEECALVVAYDVVSSLNSVVSETKDWARPSPIVMEQCQEALSCLYYLFQRFPSQLTDSNILEASLTVILSVLNSIAFSRDCFVAAGVCFFAALQVCLNPQQLALFIIRGIFNRITVNSVISVNELRNVIDKVPYKGDLCDKIANFAVLSRLCLIRGVLTAVSRDVLNTRFDVERESDDDGGGGNCVMTILYDGILPELCEYCENPSDSHFNFHALTVLQICLQQIKTSVLANISNPSGDYELITEEMGARIMRIVWNNLEDPLSQTVRQVHLVFDLFLDIQSSLCWSEGGERIKSFLEKITSYLLCLGPRCKGRYVPLASLTRRLGAKTMLEKSPDLLYETIQAYVDDDVCCAVTTFLKCFLEYLRDECWSSEGIANGYAVYRGNCLPPLLYGLGSGLSKLRSNLNTYALPVILEVDVDSIFTMLAFISIGPNGAENGLLYHETGLSNMELKVEQQVAILVSLFKVSRLLALIEGDIDWCKKNGIQDKEGGLGSDRFSCNALVCIKGIEVEVPVEWLVLALTHVDESLRVDAAESLFLNPKTSSLPSHLELTLMKEAVPLNMRCCSTAFQMKWSSLFRKFFSRVRTALERQFKQGSWQPLVYHGNTEVHFLNGSEETTVNRADDLFHFMRWFSSFLFFSCYPSAPYKRKIMAMDLILIMLNIWSIVPSYQEDYRSLTPESCLYPYNKGITLPDSTLLLVGSIVDSWDRLRENSFRILLHFPTPLPGISSEDMVQKVIAWAKKLVCSPRVRESDAGSLTLRFIFRKYVLELGWFVNASINLVCFRSQPELVNGDDQTGKTRHPVIEYMKSLIDWLNVTVEEGERDLPEACKNSFVHGVLLALRYTFEELDWNSDVVLASFLEMRHLLEKLLELIMRITSLALWVVSADAWYLPEDMDEMVDDDNFLFEVSDDVDVQAHSSDHEDKSSKVVQDARPSDQIVMVGCWLAMKEVSLLLGTIIRKIPLPSSGASDTLEFGVLHSDADSSLMTESDAMLDVKQLEKIGSHFLEVLLKMKHNGAIDKTRAGFTALCNRLLCSNDPTLCKLTESWMEQLMERTVAKGQIVDDLLRRSAGIPAAFIALFLSEPEGAPKKLLPRALRWLIDVANGSLLNLNETNGTNGDSCIILSTKRNQETKSAMQPEIIESKTTSKIRHEGLVPTVHAFNVLRAAFNDTNLATDTSGFSAEALIISIRSFSSPYWEVRNSACLAYTALVRRMIGFLNIQKRESARRALSGLEFFHRYPSLHTFVFNELKVATEMLGDVSSGHSESDLANVVHPSLCPLLILLSRLKPSTIASETGDELDPFLFMPFIRKCSTQSNLRVRVLASRALTGLVSNEKLPIVLHNIASELPFVENQLTESSVSSISLRMALGSIHASFNSIHGILLQLISLLDMNCRNLSDFLKKDQILGDFIQVLVTRSWIGSPRWCPCPILNTSFLRVLDHMLSIARTFSMSKNFYAIRNLLLESSTECLDVEASYGLSYYDPTIAELREQAAMSYFSCVFQASKEVSEEFQMPQRCPTLDSKLLKITEMENPFAGLQERLIRSLSDTSYEVRVTTLKWLLKFVKAIESGSEVHDLSSVEIRIIKNWTKSSLHETMIKLLDSEKNNRCTYYILRILFAWNLLQFQKHGDDKCTKTFYIGGMDCDSLFQFWDKLISLYKLTRHSKTRETLICCMGVCVKQFAGLFMSIVGLRISVEHCQSEKLERSARLYDCIIFFTTLIKQHSASSEPVSMRKAAAESVIASGLLEQAVVIDSSVLNNQIPCKDSHSHFEPNEAVNMYAHQILDIWFTCIQLLEDEDDGIRQRLALDVQKCFTLERCGRCSHAGKVPNQVEKVIALCFDHLSSIFGHWIEYFDYLSQWVLNAASYAIPKGDLVRRVFDKEIDNHHEEKLLLSQICCSHLENLPVSKSWAVNFSDKDGMRSYLHNCRHRFCHQLISFAKDHVEKQGGADWIGGVGNHKDAFLPLYANLLGFYALSNIILNEKAGDGRHLLSDVVELGRTITLFLRNPLIFNLYLLVVKLHEKNVSSIPDHLIPEFRDGCIWDGFEPYFLLR